jgi:hypothetical protein
MLVSKLRWSFIAQGSSKRLGGVNCFTKLFHAVVLWFCAENRLIGFGECPFDVVKPTPFQVTHTQDASPRDSAEHFDSFPFANGCDTDMYENVRAISFYPTDYLCNVKVSGCRRLKKATSG